MTTYYEILGIPQALQDESSLSAQTLRSAYRRALLQNHPDKSNNLSEAPMSSRKVTYSVDQISEAFSILSNSKLRADYDKELRLRAATTNNGGQGARQVFRTGVEILDLDDLSINEAEGIWYRSCRCGDDRGFLIREEDLEEAADDGEISVGCKGCSLWMKVLFGVMEDDTQDPAVASRDQKPMKM